MNGEDKIVNGEFFLLCLDKFRLFFGVVVDTMVGVILCVNVYEHFTTQCQGHSMVIFFPKCDKTLS